MAEGSASLPEPDQRAKERGRKALEASRHLAKVVAALRVVSKNLQSYSPGHPAVAQAASQMTATLREAARHAAPLEIEITDAGLTHRSVPLYDVKDLSAELLELCRKKGIGKIAFDPALDEKEAVAFVETLRTSLKSAADVKALSVLLERQGVVHAVLHPAPEPEDDLDALERLRAAEQTDAGGGPRIQDPRLLYRALVEFAKEAYAQARSGAHLSVRHARALCRDVALFVEEDPAALVPLASSRRYDDYLYTHPVNVCLLATAVAARYTDLPLLDAAISALLFDLGEAQLPEDVALVAHRLSDQEKEAFQEHPMRGAALLAAAEGVPKMAVAVAFEHHIGGDFQGFPSIRRRWRLNFLTQVVAVADRYDALTSPRPHHRVCRPAEAMQQVEEWVGGRFDRTAFEAFAETVGPFPPGTWAKTGGGELALVERWDPAARAAGLLVVSTEKGALLDAPERRRIALSEGQPAPLVGLDANQVPLNALDYLYSDAALP